MLLVYTLGCAHLRDTALDAQLGSAGLSADLHNGVGGLVGAPGGSGPDPRAVEGWSRFDRTDAPFAALLAMPAARWHAQSKDLTERLRAQDALVALLEDVLQIGAGRPGIAALVRIGLVYEDTQRWLDADPIVPTRYTTGLYRFVYPVLAPFGAPAPFPVPPDELFRIGGCPEYPYRERAIAAYEMALQKAYQLDLQGEPAVRVAVDRLAVLDPEGHPRRWERIPGDPAPFEEAF
jgi:hypothetical protein